MLRDGCNGFELGLVQSGFITTEEQAALKAKGAVGDILSRFIDGHGQIVDADLDARTIGLDLRYCAEREFSIGVAAGANKHPVVRACVRARYFNVLVTDEATARFLLEDKSNPVRDECGVDDERR